MARKGNGSNISVPPDVASLLASISDDSGAPVVRRSEASEALGSVVNPAVVGGEDLSEETERARQKTLRAMGKSKKSEEAQYLERLRQALGEEQYLKLLSGGTGNESAPALAPVVAVHSHGVAPSEGREPVVLSTSDRIECTSCGKPIGEDFRFCPYCGEVQKRWCICGEKLQSQFMFCPHCGAPREQGVPDPPEQLPDKPPPEQPVPDQEDVPIPEPELEVQDTEEDEPLADVLRSMLDLSQEEILMQALGMFQNTEECEVPFEPGRWNLNRDEEGEAYLESPEGEWLYDEEDMVDYLEFQKQLEIWSKDLK